MWVLLGPGDAALVPSPSYPIHIWGPILAGAEVRHVRLGPDQDFFANLLEAWEESWPRPQVIVLSFPHNPTTACVDLDFMTAHGRVRARARRAARARLRLRRPRLRRLRPAVDPAGAGRDRRRGRALHADEVVLDGGVARRVPARQRRGGRRAREAQELPRLRHVPADPDRGDGRDERAARLPEGGERDLPRPARTRSIDGLEPRRLGDRTPKGTMFVWAPIPEPYEELGSLEFAKMLVREAKVAVSPGRRASAPAARASCASRWSRTSTASTRPSAASSAPSPSSADRPLTCDWRGCTASRRSAAQAAGSGRRRGRHSARHGASISAASAAGCPATVLVPVRGAASAGDVPHALGDARRGTRRRAPWSRARRCGGRSTPSTSAWNWHSRSIALAPPSTRSSVTRDAGCAAVMASTTSAVCHAIASTAARTRCARVVPRVSPNDRAARVRVRTTASRGR